MFAITLCALLALSSAPSQELPQHPSQIKTPKLATFTPAAPVRVRVDGTQLLLLEDHSLPLVDGTLIFQAGALREPADLTGLADLWAECLRDGGSTQFTGFEFKQWLDARAIQLSFESTENQLRISFNCLSQDLDSVLAKIGQVLTAPAFEAGALETARGQMLTAIERANDDGPDLADATMKRVLFGERTLFGRQATSKSVGAITRADLVAFTKAHIAKDRLVIGLSGDFDPQLARQACTKSFKALDTLGPATPLALPTFNTVEQTTIFVLDRPGVPQTELRLGGRGLRLDAPDQAALTLWSYVVGSGGMTNRLMGRVRTELGLAYGVGCGFSPSLWRPGQFYGYCATRNDAVAQALGEMLEIITASGASRIPDDELEAARARLLTGQFFSIDSASEVLDRALTLAFYDKPETLWLDNLERLAATSAAEIQSALRQNLAPGKFICVAVGPADEIVSALSSVAKVIVLKEESETASADQKVDEMLAALGGREAWAALNAVHIKQQATIKLPSGEAKVQIEQWRRFMPLSIRLRQRTAAGSTYTNVITSTAGWLKAPTGISRVPADNIATWQTVQNRWLYLNLHLLAAKHPSRRTSLDSDGRIQISDDLGHLGWIELGPDNRPSAMGTGLAGSEEIFKYSRWTENDGLYFAMEYSQEQQTVVIESFEAVSAHPDGTFEL